MAEKLPGFLQPEPPRRFHLAGKPELSVLHRAEIPKHEIIVLRIVIAADIPHVQDFQHGFLAYLPESGLLGGLVLLDEPRNADVIPCRVGLAYQSVLPRAVGQQAYTHG